MTKGKNTMKYSQKVMVLESCKIIVAPFLHPFQNWREEESTVSARSLSRGNNSFLSGARGSEGKFIQGTFSRQAPLYNSSLKKHSQPARP
jgi:hypothetical protein